MIICVIPARGGSRRIPGKNIRPLLGRPLIAWSIEAALDSGVFDRIVVSTDSEEIAAVAAEFGETIPMLRDPGLADDVTPSSTVSLDVLNRIDPLGNEVSAISQMLPTCALRTAEDVRESFRAFENGQAKSQISVVRFAWMNAWWALELGTDRLIRPLFPEALAMPSQTLSPLYCPSGAVWWTRPANLREKGTYWALDGTCSGWEIDWKHAVDIDNPEDWEQAESLMFRGRQTTE